MEKIAEKKHHAAQWFKELSDQFCSSFQKIDGGSNTPDEPEGTVADYNLQ